MADQEILHSLIIHNWSLVRPTPTFGALALIMLIIMIGDCGGEGDQVPLCALCFRAKLRNGARWLLRSVFTCFLQWLEQTGMIIILWQYIDRLGVLTAAISRGAIFVNFVFLAFWAFLGFFARFYHHCVLIEADIILLDFFDTFRSLLLPITIIRLRFPLNFVIAR